MSQYSAQSPFSGRSAYPGQSDLSVSPREEKIRRLARRAAAEGMVLLENNGVLPLRENAALALFGRGARYTIKGGTGSGDVNSRNTITVEQGLRNAGFRIVNSAWLDRYDALYAQARQRWDESVYAAAGPERDPKKLYQAHASTPLPLPEIPIGQEDAAGADCDHRRQRRDCQAAAAGAGPERAAEPGRTGIGGTGDQRDGQRH